MSGLTILFIPKKNPKTSDSSRLLVETLGGWLSVEPVIYDSWKCRLITASAPNDAFLPSRMLMLMMIIRPTDISPLMALLFAAVLSSLPDS